MTVVQKYPPFHSHVAERSPDRKRVAVPIKAISLTFAAALCLSACIDREEAIYSASAEGGDYAILDCSQLEVAERSIGQRLSGAVSYAVTEEPSALLSSQKDQIQNTRTARACPGDVATSLVSPAEVVEASDGDLTLADATYLQVATFRVEANRDATVETLRAQGFETIVRPIQLAGQTYYRVLVGPVASVAEIARIDAATIRLGFNDSFFVKG